MKPKFKTQKELQSLDIKELENEKKILNQYTGNLQVLITNYDKSLSLFREDLKELVWLYKKYYIFLENNSRFIEVTKSESSLLIFSKNSVVKKLIIGNSEKSEFLRLYKEFISFGDKMFQNIRPYVRNKMTDEYEPTWVLLTSKKYSKGDPEIEFPLDTSKLSELSTHQLDHANYETKALSTFSFPFDIFTDHTNLESETYSWFSDFKYEVQVQRFMDPWGFKVFSKNDLINTLNQIKEDVEPYERKIELMLRASYKGEEKIENVGYVYVLSNDAYPNIYKIGSTYGLPEERAEELTGTGHLTPFKVVGKIKIKSAEYYEKVIHKLLDEYRVKQGREFFKLDLGKIKECLEQVSEISRKGEDKITLSELKKEIRL
jgi:hypothetical protein